MSGEKVVMEYYHNDILEDQSTLPIECTLSDFENYTAVKTREKVFAKYIHYSLEYNELYESTKTACARVASTNLAKELNDNLNYNASLPRFLRMYSFEYYYAKTTSAGVEIYKVPSAASLGNDIIIESIEPYVPEGQANIYTTIKNTKTGKILTLRNECRFSHGQFNGTPEAKLYYKQKGDSLEVIYEKL